MAKSNAGKILTTLIVISICGLTMLFLFITRLRESTTESAPTQKEKIETTIPEYDSGIKDFGLGIYYFPQIGSDFGRQLRFFLESHTNLEVSAIAGEVVRFNCTLSPQCDYGATTGYFVTFREKK